jgi:DeoR/GlpR family transcriptional regulator of sugar metabolism
MLVLTFGLEGDTLKDALMEGEYCKVGLAHFPEIVGPTCVEAAIAAFNHEPLPTRLVTPFSLLTAETLPDVYTRTSQGWRINWNVVRKRYNLPLALDDVHSITQRHLPRRIGFIVPFHEHEWYRSLIEIMRERTLAYGIDFEVVDAEKNARQEADLRRRAIARAAATLVSEGDVVLVDGGLLAGPVAEALRGLQNITVITNSLVVFEVLDANPNVTLILTGGAYRRSIQMLVGPTAENALRELRADKLFLMVSGISQNFGLSHTNISEVTIKQAMIRSAREVILLADHSFFGIESVAQVAPLKIVNKLVTDDGLPASVRLDLSKLGIQILLAHL